MGIQVVLAEVQAERKQQDLKWGEQNHPDLSPFFDGSRPTQLSLDTEPQARFWWLRNVARYYQIPLAGDAKFACQGEFADGQGSWFSIHIEELAEALEQFALGNVEAGREELVQLAATVVAHVEALDRRRAEVNVPRGVTEGDAVTNDEEGQ